MRLPTVAFFRSCYCKTRSIGAQMSLLDFGNSLAFLGGSGVCKLFSGTLYDPMGSCDVVCANAGAGKRARVVYISCSNVLSASFQERTACVLCTLLISLSQRISLSPSLSLSLSLYFSLLLSLALFLITFCLLDFRCFEV